LKGGINAEKHGCPAGIGSAGIVGGLFALCAQNWKTFVAIFRRKEKITTSTRRKIMGQIFNVTEITIGYHPSGYRIDKTASPLNRYTRRRIMEDGMWVECTPVCFDSMPPEGWVKSKKFDWN